MSRSYSTDLRVRVIGAISGDLSARQAAARFGIGVSTAVAWYRRYRETGEVAARKQGQAGGSKLDAHEAFILALVRERPDISLAEEIAERLAEERAVSACPATVWYFLERRGMSFKKTAHAAEQERPDVALRRQAWFEARPALDPEKLIFIDETGVSTNTTERMKSFNRSVASAPYGSQQNGRRALWRESQGRGCARPAPEGH